jgi:hypothetical protein
MTLTVACPKGVGGDGISGVVSDALPANAAAGSLDVCAPERA